MNENIAVVGAGTMGIGVSHAFASAGNNVTLVDVSKKALDRAQEEIGRNNRLYGLLGHKEKVAGGATSRITYTTELEDIGDACFLVENVTEKWEVKEPLYRRLDVLCAADCVLAVNTSAIPITRIAGLTDRADRVVGAHFMNPAPLMPLVEVIRGFHTSERTIAFTELMIRGIGKDSVTVEDSPGFVTNRVMMLTVNEAMCLVQEGVAGAADVDRMFVECFGHKMGPLATADLIGLDTVLFSLDVLLDNFNDPKYRPCTLLRKLVDAGHLGRKTGRGFHTYLTGDAH